MSSKKSPKNGIKDNASVKFNRIMAIILSALMCVGAITYIVFAILGQL
ncbi:MAG: hypothetical protein MR471_06130 [Clostridia bacterium]|nr:hypothetical protein [Clostridia bacterium]MDY3784748.1 hypothetical protein [Eubacteriales bacterium]